MDMIVFSNSYNLKTAIVSEWRKKKILPQVNWIWWLNVFLIVTLHVKKF